MTTLSNEEKVFSLAKATKRVANHPHLSTLWRWATKGCRGIRLKTTLIGGQRYTTDEYLEQFFAAINAKSDGEPIPLRSSTARERAIQEAELELSR